MIPSTSLKSPTYCYVTYLESVITIALRRARTQRRLNGRSHTPRIGNMRVIVVVMVHSMGATASAAPLVRCGCKQAVDTGAGG